MSRRIALLDQFWAKVGSWLVSARGQTISVLVLLTTQAGLLAYSATRHSPTHLEPAFLAAGISHWQFGRFELYRVNPPLPRMIATLPVLAVGSKTDWSHYYDGPGSRAEFPVGEDFIKANGPRSISLFIYARWACVPFALIGSVFAYRWARELYGGNAGLLTLYLWIFDPNLLAHAELVTPDSACVSFGVAAGYMFWRWLKSPNWIRACQAGVFLGLALLSKLSWLLLLGLWPLLWLVWRVSDSQSTHQLSNGAMVCANVHSAPKNRPGALQLAAIIAVGVYVLNLGYAFDGTFTRLGQFEFVSSALTGSDTPGKPGNRFSNTIIAELPVPIPKQYLVGLDVQKKDFEHFEQRSYLRGEWKDGGWWYYYVYGLLVKTTCGTLGILLLVVILRIVHAFRCEISMVDWRDEGVLITPGLCLLILVSSQTEFNQHLRYVFPCVGAMLVFIGQAAGGVGIQANCMALPDRVWWRRHLATMLLATYSAVSCMFTYPHHLSYFNDIAGGATNGWKHLLGSSFDWGQDGLLILAWERSNDCVVQGFKPGGGVPSILDHLRRHDIAPRERACSVMVVSRNVDQSIEGIAIERIGMTTLVVPIH